MKIYEVEKRTPALLERLLQLWETSVRATHGFLSEAEIGKIRGYVPRALREVPRLVVAETDSGRLAGFLGADGPRLEMLFLAPEERGAGLGRRLLEYGMGNLGIRELTVNEQNPQAVGLYTHMGFQTYRRTARDEEGNPYPLLYMKLG